MLLSLAENACPPFDEKTEKKTMVYRVGNSSNY